MEMTTPPTYYKCRCCGAVGHDPTLCRSDDGGCGRDAPEDTILDPIVSGEIAPVEMDVVYDTEMGNAERFVDQHLETILYCHQYNSWYVWDPPIWRRDEDGAIMVMAKLTVRSIYREAASLEDDGARKARATHARKSEGERAVRAMLSLAQSDQRIVVRPEVMDTHPHYLATPLGVIDLRTGKPNPLTTKEVQNLYLTKATRAAPWPHDDECPIFMECMDTWTGGDKEMVDFLQLAVGYTLTGETGEEVFFFIHGPARSGKTKFITAIQNALGDLVKSVDPSVMMMGRQRTGEADPEIAKLPGVRMAVTFETEERQRMAEAKVKRLTGGDIISTRPLYGHPFDFGPQCKFWLASNHRPQVSAHPAVWERMIVLPFDHVIPPEDRDTHLGEKLRGEANGILAWAIEGARRYYEEGIRASIPKQCLTAAREYRNDMDDVGRWIGEKCEVGPPFACSFAELWDDYLSWCEADGIEPVPKRAFGNHLKAHGCPPSETRGLGGVKRRQCIRLKSQASIGGQPNG